MMLYAKNLEKRTFPENIKNVIDNIVLAGFLKDFTIIMNVDAGGRPYTQIQGTTPCNDTGKTITWKGRKHWLSEHMCDNEVVRTVKKMVDDAVSHELDENFYYKNVRIFDPHMNYNKLSAEISFFPSGWQDERK